VGVRRERWSLLKRQSEVESLELLTTVVSEKPSGQCRFLLGTSGDTMHRAVLLVLLFAASPVTGEERVVWQIGKPDHDYSEFAFAGNYPCPSRKSCPH
jgi:hypothetical protein